MYVTYCAPYGIKVINKSSFFMTSTHVLSWSIVDYISRRTSIISYVGSPGWMDNDKYSPISL